MDQILIIIFVLIFAALGYFLMNLVDHTLVSNMQSSFLKRDESEAVLIFTDKNNELESLQLKKEIKDKKTRIIKDIESYKLIRADILIAMSDNDLENMTICSDFKHYFPSIFTIARCNDGVYEEIFNNVGIDVVILNSDFHVKTLESIKRWDHV